MNPYELRETRIKALAEFAKSHELEEIIKEAQRLFFTSRRTSREYAQDAIARSKAVAPNAR